MSWALLSEAGVIGARPSGIRAWRREIAPDLSLSSTSGSPGCGGPAPFRRLPLALAASAWHTDPRCVSGFVRGQKTLRPSSWKSSSRSDAGRASRSCAACSTACSKVFQAAIKTRRFLYNVRILRDSTLGVQVIAVGNLTVGGTGKTPVVEKFARELRDQGRNVAILSRGYRSKPPPFHQWLLNKFFCGMTPLRRASCRTANRCCWIPKWPATSPTCSPPISRTWSCWWTRTASRAAVTRSRSSAATRSCSTTVSSTGNSAAGGRTSC